MLNRTVKYATAVLTKTTSDGSGTFDFLIRSFEIDRDNERITNFVDLPARLPLVYQHADVGDPMAEIGRVTVHSDPAGLRGSGKLDLGNPMAIAVYERMLLPSTDKRALNELSIGFSFDPTKTTKGPKGERLIPDAKLWEISVVYRGAQRTEVMNVKQTARDRMWQAAGLTPAQREVKAVYDRLNGLIADLTPTKAALGDNDVDAFLAEFREERDRERAAAERLAVKARSLSLLPNELIAGVDEDRERDRERFDRDAALIAAHDAERAEEAAIREAVDAARRVTR